jgi:hypothetical protein
MNPKRRKKFNFSNERMYINDVLNEKYEKIEKIEKPSVEDQKNEIKLIKNKKEEPKKIEKKTKKIPLRKIRKIEKNQNILKSLKESILFLLTNFFPFLKILILKLLNINPYIKKNEIY